MICSRCNKQLENNDVSLGMNLPYVTDGPQYWCHSCKSVTSPEDIIEEIECFLNPIKESN